MELLVERLRALLSVLASATGSDPAVYTALAKFDDGWQVRVVALGSDTREATSYVTPQEALRAEIQAAVSALRDWKRARQEEVNAINARIIAVDRALRDE